MLVGKVFFVAEYTGIKELSFRLFLGILGAHEEMLSTFVLCSSGVLSSVTHSRSSMVTIDHFCKQLFCQFPVQLQC